MELEDGAQIQLPADVLAHIGAYTGAVQLLHTLAAYVTSLPDPCALEQSPPSAAAAPTSTAIASAHRGKAPGGLLLQVLQSPLRCSTVLEWSDPRAHPCSPIRLLPSLTSLTASVALTRSCLANVTTIRLPRVHVMLHGGLLPLLTLLRLLPSLESLSIPHAHLCAPSVHALTQLRLRHLNVSHAHAHGTTRVTTPTPLHEQLQSLEAVDAMFPLIHAAPRRRHVSVVQSAFSQLESFTNIHTLTVALRDYNHIQALVPLAQLRTLTLCHTRICTLRTHTQAFVAVMTRVMDLTLADCDPFPRTHLLEPPHGPLSDILGHAYGLTRLTLMRLPLTFMTDGSLIPCMRPLRGRLTHLHISGEHAFTDAWLRELTEHTSSCLEVLRIYHDRNAFTSKAVQAMLVNMNRLRDWALPHTRAINDAVLLAYVRDCPSAQLCTDIDVTACGVLRAGTLCQLERMCTNLRRLCCRSAHACMRDTCACGAMVDWGTRLRENGELETAAAASTAFRGHTGRDVLDRLRSRGVVVEYTPLPVRTSFPVALGACFHEPEGNAHHDGTSVVEAGLMLSSGEANVCACGARVRQLDQLDHVQICNAAQVHCPLYAHGCAWTGVRASTPAHAASCEAWVVTCPLRCGEEMTRDKLHQHVRAHYSGIERASWGRFCIGIENGCQFVCRHVRGCGGGITGTDCQHGCLEAHVRVCELAPRVCVSCGGLLPDTTRLVCDGEHCVERGLRRTRMPHIRVVDIDVPAAVVRAAMAARQGEAPCAASSDSGGEAASAATSAGHHES